MIDNYNPEAETMTNALGDLFFSIYQVNLDTGRMVPLRIGDEVKGLIDDGEIQMDDFVKVLAEVFYHSRSQNELISTFNLNSLRKFKQDGIEKVERELVRMYRGTYHRVACIACLGKHFMRDSNIIVAVQDIEEQCTMRQNQFDMVQSLSSVYYTMYYIDLETNVITAVDNQMDSDIMLASRGDYTQMMLLYGNNCIHYEDREAFLHFVSIHHLQKKLSFANPVMEIEYRRIYDYGMEWIRAEVILVSMDQERPQRVLLATRNITAQKNQEVKALSPEIENVVSEYQTRADSFLRLTKELRTPVNGMIGMANVAECQINQPDKVLELLRQIKFCGSQMLDTINEMITYSRLQNGELIFNEEEVPMVDFFSSLVGDYEQQLKEKGHHLAAKQSVFRHEIVMADRQYLKQIMDAVMDNAIRYTKSGGELVFAVQELHCALDNYACFQVMIKDNGYGMSQEFLKNLFQPFHSLQDYRVAQERGIGLGMTIAHALVERMHGSMEVESEVDEGTTVRITLNFALPGKKQKDSNAEELGQCAYEPAAITSFSGKRILLYEPEKADFGIAQILRLTSITVQKVDSLDDLVQAFAQEDGEGYQMIIVSVCEEIRALVRVLQKLRKQEQEQAQEIPVLAVFDAKRMQLDEAQCRQQEHLLETNGVCEVLSGPVTMEMLLKALGWWMK